jgi:putative addiction module component (TIGR02574 family)
MATDVDKLALEIRSWPDLEKLRLVDAILSDLEKPDPEIDGVWAEEARSRWAAYKAGRIPTVAYEEVMAKHRRG